MSPPKPDATTILAAIHESEQRQEERAAAAERRQDERTAELKLAVAQVREDLRATDTRSIETAKEVGRVSERLEGQGRSVLELGQKVLEVEKSAASRAERLSILESRTADVPTEVRSLDRAAVATGARMGVLWAAAGALAMGALGLLIKSMGH